VALVQATQLHRFLRQLADDLLAGVDVAAALLLAEGPVGVVVGGSRRRATRGELGRALRTWIDEIEAGYAREVGRARRLRNGLTHSGAGQVELAATVRVLMNNKARNVARLALGAVLADQSIEEGLNDWRLEFAALKGKMAHSHSAREALIEAAE
jgi:hypothetical protein